jgi:hypothetical protein
MRLWRVIGALGPLALLLAGPGNAQQQAKPVGIEAPELRPSRLRPATPARVWASADGRIIYLVGKIERGTFRQFMEVARAHPRAEVLFLASGGGILLDGYLIGNAVRARKLDTWVEHTCASSCTQIFASGRERLFGRNARLGFHQSYQEDRTTGEVLGTDYSKDEALAETIGKGDRFDATSGGDDKLVRALRRAGVSETFIGKVLRTPPEQFWFPEAAELQIEGMVTRLVDAEPRLQMPLSELGRRALGAELAANPLWRALQSREPAMYEAALLDIWRDANSGFDRNESEFEEKFKVIQKLATRVVSAPDPLLEKFATIYASQGELQRRLGYPGCDKTEIVPGSAMQREVRAQLATFEEPLAALLESPVQVPRMPADKAQKLFRKHAKRVATTGIDFSEQGSGTEYDCRMAFRTDEAINRLEPKYRLMVFRAWLSL